MPVHLPKSIFLINKANGMATSFPIPQSGYKRQPLKKGGAYTCRPFLDRNEAVSKLLNSPSVPHFDETQLSKGDTTTAKYTAHLRSLQFCQDLPH